MTTMMKINGDGIAQNRNHALRHEIVQSVDVTGEPGDQPSDRILVEEPQTQPLQVVEDLSPHIVHDVLPDPLQHVVHRVLER